MILWENLNKGRYIYVFKLNVPKSACKRYSMI